MRNGLSLSVKLTDPACTEPQIEEVKNETTELPVTEKPSGIYIKFIDMLYNWLIKLDCPVLAAHLKEKEAETINFLIEGNW